MRIVRDLLSGMVVREARSGVSTPRISLIKFRCISLLLLAAMLFLGLGDNANATIYYDTAPEANAGCQTNGAAAKVHHTMVKQGYYCEHGLGQLQGPDGRGFYTCMVYGHYVGQSSNKFSMNCGLYDNTVESSHWYAAPCASGQSWDEQTRQCGEPNADKNLGAPPCEDGCFSGSVNAGNGNRFEAAFDYVGSGSLPLGVAWTYNSAEATNPVGPSLRIFGKKRVAHGIQSIHRVTATDSIEVAYFTHADGKVSGFRRKGQNWIGFAGTKLKLAASYAASGDVSGWTLNDGDGKTYKFSAEGRLDEVTNRQGGRNVLHYDASGRVEKVVDQAGRELAYAYNANGWVDTIDLPGGGQLKYDYDASGYLVRTEYPDGSSRVFAYSEAGLVALGAAEGLLTGVVDENGGRYSTTTYDSSKALAVQLAVGVGGISAIYQPTSNQAYNAQANADLPLGASRTIAFKAVNGLVLPISSTTTCSGCVGQNVAYTYDRHGFMDVVTSNGTMTDYDFNARGFETRRVVAANVVTEKHTIQTDWVDALDVPSERRTYNAANALMSRTNWAYNARGQALTMTRTEPLSATTRVTTSTYCEQVDVAAGMCPLVGLLTSVDGPRTDASDSTSYTYFPAEEASCAVSTTTCAYRKGDLWKVTNAKGQVVEYVKYDGAGRPLSVKDPNGVITDYEYHPRGWLTASKVRGPDNTVETDDAITRVAYWPTGLVKQVTQPGGAFTLYTYDAAHRLTDISDNAGNTIHYVLDNAGNRLAEETKDAGGALKRTLSRIYNQLGQLATQADSQANPTDFSYDANGNANTVTDALGRVTDHDHDPLNRLARTLQDVGGIAAETKFQYDALDNLTKVTDPKGLNTSYTYNGLGDLTQLQSPDTGTTTYTYDSAGNRASQTDARGVTTTYAYDALNRLTAVNYPDTALNVSYTYDSAPTVCEAGETFGVGRLSGMDDASGSTRYCYNRFGHLVRKVQTTNGVSFVVRYAYTLAGNLQAMVYPDGTTVDYGRNAQGQVTEVGVTRSGQPRQVLLHQASYHPFGPVAGWTYGNGRSLSRTLDQDYRPLTIEDPNTGGLSLGFGYDAVGNLTTLGTAQGMATPAIRFGYDALGRLTRTEDGPTQAAIDVYAYDATGNRTAHTTAAGTAAYTYPTTSHRLTDVAGVPRTYDAVGNTTAIDANRGFAYNDANRMSLVQQSGVTTRQYAYNGRGEQVRRYLGATNTYTVYDEAGHWLGDYDDSGAPVQQALWMDDLPVGLLANGNQLHYLQPDHLGSPRVVIEAARNVPVWTWDLKGEAFGSTAPQQDPDGDGIPFVLDMRFPGQRYDAASALNYNYFRSYEAGVGRYTQSDPMGLNGGLATYAYVDSTPLVSWDFFGLAPYFTDGPPSGRNVMGWVSCHKGSVNPVTSNHVIERLYGKCSAPITECVLAHERSHVVYLAKTSPSTCQERFWEPAYWRVRHLRDSSSTAATELSAHAVELRCLTEKLKQYPCDEACKETILRAIRDRSQNIVNILYGHYGRGR
ncbi:MULTISPECIES: RHS repeat protein [unclassified Pseudoxanthomonas]|uniref:RHS repeat domain-containing protein n=1 Tax=unclassified Pseudoxanthomonas TaxID=2645906 RepID=UPI001620B3BB|nr:MULTISPECIES: RHS repeat protein [unclassified Pseudoxanthomonas]MBB3274275.1 RHS repeat-associated protein [Pseudoxanthomonas sp. OG2]MBV7474784.1 hypothetical protein [Pseudoxanthomonas sp. PXM05]